MCDQCNEELSEALYSEHVSLCDSSTCDINAANAIDAFAYAARLLQDCLDTGGAVQRAIARHGAEAFDALCEEQRNELLKRPHERCLKCGSVAWDINGDWLDDSDAKCPECDTRFGRFYVIPFTTTDEVDWTESRVAIYFARNRETVQGGEHDSGSWDSYVCDVTADVWRFPDLDKYDTGSAEHSGAGYVYMMRSCDCGDEGCDTRPGDVTGPEHESISVVVQWDPSDAFAEFETLDAAKAHAATLDRLAPIVIGEMEEQQEGVSA